MFRRLLLAAGTLLFLTVAFLAGALRGGRREEPGSVHPTPLPPAAVSSRTRELAPAGGGAARQILFGDLHVHTTFSSDAFQLSLPLLQGEGAHPPADACDFARFCSGLDFWSITDHAESITPRRWQETKDTIRRCDAVAGGPDGPDVVPFVGWEWTQVGVTPEDHYGHKNVILRNLEDASLPARPIAATGRFARVLRYGIIASRSWWDRVRFPLLDFRQRQRYLDMGVFFAENRAVPDCPRGIDTRQLPADCYETADTPQELFEKLSQWGFDVIVIPHGTTWGLYTPPGSTFDKQLTVAQHDPEKQTLFEVYSGHGNSEEYRAWKAVDRAADGTPVCPEPTREYEPCCRRAGEIVRARCDDVPAEECEGRVRVARANYLAAAGSGRATIPDSEVEDWKDCGQCRVAIRAADYERAVADVGADRRDRAVGEALRRRVLDRLVEEELLVQHGLALGLARSDRRVRAELTAAVIGSILAAPGEEPSDDEVAVFFAEHAELFRGPGRVRVEQIFFGAARADEAVRARHRLDAGESFAAVRAGGDPEPVPVPEAALPPARLVDYLGPTAARTALELSPGQVGGPVRSGWGHHLVHVVAREEAATPPLAAVREEVRAELRRRDGDRRLRRYLDELRAAAEVVVAEEAR